MLLLGILALGVGFVLGLLGGGGSILSVPIFAYIMHWPTKQAIASSLLVVGTMSLYAAVFYARRGLGSIKIILNFGLSSMMGAYGGAWLARYIDAQYQMILFATVMLSAAIFMLRKGSQTEATELQLEPKTMIFLSIVGLGVGLLTGIVGVGGGFLIVPTLILIAKVPVRHAVACSLWIMALNALSGFAAYAQVLTLPYGELTLFIGMGILGTSMGARFAANVSPTQIRRIFAYFLFLIAFWILYQNFT